MTGGVHSASGVAPDLRVHVAQPAFAVELVRGPAWDAALDRREQAGWAEHAALMDGLVADGLVLYGGPVGDGRKTLHLVQARDEHELRRRLAEDPWARTGLLEVGEVRPWALWLDQRRRAAPG